jgi:hypothetical protein
MRLYAQGRDHPGELPYFRKVPFHGGDDRWGTSCHMMLVSRQQQVRDYPVNVFCILMMPVVAILVLYVQYNRRDNIAYR